MTSGARLPTNTLKSLSGHSDKVGSTHRSPAAVRTNPTFLLGGALGGGGRDGGGGAGSAAADLVCLSSSASSSRVAGCGGAAITGFEEITAAGLEIGGGRGGGGNAPGAPADRGGTGGGGSIPDVLLGSCCSFFCSVVSSSLS